MATIIGGVTMEDWFEDLLELAAFPPAAQYDTFGSGVFGTTQRLKSANSFVNYGSKSLYPLMRWRTVSAVSAMEYAQAVKWRGTLEVAFAAGGPMDHDATVGPSTKRLARYWAQLSEVVAKQISGTGYSDGAFFRSNAGVTAPGVQILGIGDVSLEPETARRDTELGLDVWVQAGIVRIDAVAGPGA